MKRKLHLRASLSIISMGFFLSLFLLCQHRPCLAAQEEINYVSARNYFNALIQEIERANSSITAYLYQFSINPQHSESLTLQIAGALVRAKKRGVHVEVVLDQNVDFTDHPSQDLWADSGKNWTAYEFLSKNDIPVYFDPPTTYLHAKAVVFDKETVLLGSSNWSQISLTRNFETNMLIRSKKIAQDILEDLSSIKKEKPPEEGPSVPIPLSYMESGHLLGRMVNNRDTGGFDLYTALLKMAWERGTAEFDVAEEEIANLLGLAGKPGIGYQRGLFKAYRRLEKKYRLLRHEIIRGEGVHVQLKNLSNSDAVLNLEFDKKISIPLAYWSLGWNKKLSLPGKIFYFLSLYYESISDKKPQWSLSEVEIARNFHVSAAFIGLGVTELRRANLIEVMYDPIEYDPLTKKSKPRRANTYVNNPFYDPLLIEKKLKELQEKYGEELIKDALKYAALVYEENDLPFIEQLIHLELQHGRDTMELVYNKLKLKDPSNPKRSPGYFINTVKSIGS